MKYGKDGIRFDLEYDLTPKYLSKILSVFNEDELVNVPVVIKITNMMNFPSSEFTAVCGEYNFSIQFEDNVWVIQCK